MSLVCECPCQHGLAGSRGAVEKDASSDPCSEILELIWMMQEVDDLSEFGLDNISSVEVLEGDVAFIYFGLHFH